MKRPRWIVKRQYGEHSSQEYLWGLDRDRNGWAWTAWWEYKKSGMLVFTDRRAAVRAALRTCPIYGRVVRLTESSRKESGEK